VQLVASGTTIPTAFAFGAGRSFVADAGNPPSTPGGVDVIKNGVTVPLAGSPQFVSGLAWHDNALYVAGAFFSSSGPPQFKLLRWSHFNGTAFTSRKTIYTAPADFSGFNGIAFGPDGRLYAGVDVGFGPDSDHQPANSSPYLYDILSFAADGKGGPSVFARGMRQPWQMVFPAGSSRPFVTDFGQDSPPDLNPPDFLLRVHKGDNFGFPKCNWTQSSLCKGFTRPYKFLAPHTDAGGLAIVANRLYIGEFGFANGKPQVVQMPLNGRPNAKITPFVTGFTSGLMAVGSHAGWVYMGQGGTPSSTGDFTPHTGIIYRVKAASGPPFTG
jgi:glucose/arabinose dehydrogenase